MELKSGLSFTEICRELGLQPQFLLDLAQDASSCYTTFERPKRSGGTRTICASHGRLKRIQRLLLHGVLERLSMPWHVHGGVRDRSIVTNAKDHVSQEVVINFDLCNFFGTISAELVRSVLLRHLQCDDQAADTLTKLVTVNNCLPQGAPTSPVIANLAALDVDKELMQICTELVGAGKFAYSRYVDDITISGGTKLTEAIPLIDQAVEKCGFKLNSEKTRILRPSTRQWVTGVVVNKKVTAPKTLIRRIRQQLYYSRKYGLHAHADWKGLHTNVVVQQLRGQIGYLRMTQPELADKFLEELAQVIPATSEQSHDEIVLHLLKEIIEAEQMAKFMYEESKRLVAPAEIFVDEDGFLQVRAFQLSPEQGWEVFAISAIDDLEAHSQR